MLRKQAETSTMRVQKAVLITFVLAVLICILLDKCISFLGIIRYSTEETDDFDPAGAAGSPCTVVNYKAFHWNLMDYADLRIIILTYNRARSLIRLLESLNKTYYDNDKIIIDIWVDRSKDGSVSMETVNEASKFVFGAGKCNINIHPKHVGIRGQWLDVS